MDIPQHCFPQYLQKVFGILAFLSSIEFISSISFLILGPLVYSIYPITRSNFPVSYFIFTVLLIILRKVFIHPIYAYIK